MMLLVFCSPFEWPRKQLHRATATPATARQAQQVPGEQASKKCCPKIGAVNRIELDAPIERARFVCAPGELARSLEERMLPPTDGGNIHSLAN